MNADPINPVPATLSDAPQGLPAFVPFGRFQLVARLGKGGMGDVFLAVAPGVEGANKLLVVKRLHESLLEDDGMRALFLAEGRLAARLNHQNVVQTYEVGEEGGILYLSMEYLEGQPLSQLSKKLGDANIDPIIAARIMSEALAGLHYAHELRDYGGKAIGLVHRDVSPQNVLVTHDGTTKVLDFGIAKVADNEQKTQTGILKGKIAYMAPEQALGDVDRRSDVYSAGIVLWELLARRRLMAESSQARTLARVMSGPPAPRLSTILPEIDPLLDDIVARALERSPDGRFQTAQAMRDALEAYIAKSGRFVRQEDLASLMTELFGKRRERVAEQVRSFMVATRESDSLLELPAIKGSAAARPASATGMTPSVTSEASLVESSDTSIRTLVAREPGAEPTIRPGAIFSGHTSTRTWARARLLLLTVLALSGLSLAAVALRSRTGSGATSPAGDKARENVPVRSAPAAVALPPSTPAEPAAGEPAAKPAEPTTSAPRRATGKKSQLPATVASSTKPVADAASTHGEKAAVPTAQAPAPTSGTAGKRKYRTDF